MALSSAHRMTRTRRGARGRRRHGYEDDACSRDAVAIVERSRRRADACRAEKFIACVLANVVYERDAANERELNL